MAVRSATGRIAPSYLRDSMNVQHIIQFATLFSVLVGSLGLAVAFLIHRDQVKTQIFLALSARYDELLHSSSAGVWLSAQPGTNAPGAEPRGDHVGAAILHVGLVDVLSVSRAPHTEANVALDAAHRRAPNAKSLFVREWEHLRSEFESFPEFVEFVTSVQCGTQK
jgi:hypothetical protein